MKGTGTRQLVSSNDVLISHIIHGLTVDAAVPADDNVAACPLKRQITHTS